MAVTLSLQESLAYAHSPDESEWRQQLVTQTHTTTKPPPTICQLPIACIVQCPFVPTPAHGPELFRLLSWNVKPESFCLFSPFPNQKLVLYSGKYWASSLVQPRRFVYETMLWSTILCRVLLTMPLSHSHSIRSRPWHPDASQRRASSKSRESSVPSQSPN